MITNTSNTLYRSISKCLMMTRNAPLHLYRRGCCCALRLGGTGSPGQPGGSAAQRSSGAARRATMLDPQLVPDPAEQALRPCATLLAADRNTLIHPAICHLRQVYLISGKLVLYKKTPFIEKKKTKESLRRNRWELLSQSILSKKQMGPTANRRHCHMCPMKYCICSCSAKQQSLAPLHLIAQE